MKLLSYIILFLGFFSCQQKSEQPDIRSTVSEYYETYKKREDFNQFLNFYEDDMVLEDMISGDRKVGKKEFAAFFDWDHPNFKLLDSVSMVIKNQVIDGCDVVTQGYFTPFQWGDIKVGTMQFTTILTFNQNGKIVKHVDWINYPSHLIDYQNRKDSNAWINTGNE